MFAIKHEWACKKHPNGNSKVKSKRNRDEQKKAQSVKDKLLIQYVANNKKEL